MTDIILSGFWYLLTYYFNIILISVTMHVKLSLGKLVRCIKNICFQLLLLFCGTHFIMYSKCFWGSKLHLQKDFKIFIRVLFRLQLFLGLNSCKATKPLHDQHLLPSYFEPKLINFYSQQHLVYNASVTCCKFPLHAIIIL